MKELLIHNGSTELIKVRSSDIIYVEAEGNYCCMYLAGGFKQQLWFNIDDVGRTHLDEFGAAVMDEQFFHIIYRSYPDRAKSSSSLLAWANILKKIIPEKDPFVKRRGHFVNGAENRLAGSS